ncbi:SpoIIE family protein phosphatase [Thalassospira alkalitolerans]|uniref:SpoIIE family protein phosphatase n=1 Tax=Thalassospira alkalitolerans TaxID=1293890 RepID=UPI003AA7BFDF
MALTHEQRNYAVGLRPHMHEAEGVCGDMGLVVELDDGLFIAQLDVLGHGPEASDIAIRAKSFLEEISQTDSLVDIMQALHAHLKGTRGAAVALCRLDYGKDELKYAGVGNITTKLHAPTAVTLVPRDGVVGYIMSTPREETLAIPRGAVLILHSDGVPSHLDLSMIEGLMESDPQTIVNRMINELGKKDDDVGCIVVKV